MIFEVKFRSSTIDELSFFEKNLVLLPKNKKNKDKCNTFDGFILVLLGISFLFVIRTDYLLNLKDKSF